MLPFGGRRNCKAVIMPSSKQTSKLPAAQQGCQHLCLFMPLSLSLWRLSPSPICLICSNLPIFHLITMLFDAFTVQTCGMTKRQGMGNCTLPVANRAWRQKQKKLLMS